MRGGETAGRERMHAWLKGGIDGYADGTTTWRAGRRCSRLTCTSARSPPRELEERPDTTTPTRASSRGATSTPTCCSTTPTTPTTPTAASWTRSTGTGTDEHFDAWREGRTGYPVVDAGMRQLAATGWMHNRARLITACFLVKDLHIDWRRGEQHFMRLPARRRRGQQQRQLAVDLLRGRRPRAAAPAPVQPGPAAGAPRPEGRRTSAAGCRSSRACRTSTWPSRGRATARRGRGRTYIEPIVDHAVERERTLAAYRAARDDS